MSEYQGVWVIAELTADGQLTETTQELLTPARRLGDKLGQPVTGILLCEGQACQSAQQTLAELGANHILCLSHPRLAAYNPDVYTTVLGTLMAERKPNVVLAGVSTTASDYLPRLAVRSGAALISQASDLDLAADGHVEVTRACYAEGLLSSVKAKIAPQLITVKKKAFPKAVPNLGATAEVTVLTPDLQDVPERVSLLELRAAETKGSKRLEEAEIIVSGGRGLKESSNFQLVEELAEALGAAVGASRAVVDAGWRPHAEQVGQTGKTVSPKVYFALGISGAIQHLVGMNTSQWIIAINRDENAPIFKTADFGIVGDALTIVPELTRVIKQQNLSLHV